MRQLIIFLGLFALSLSVQANQPNNVIFILADDLGWNDTSIYQQNQFYETPNIDALARKGMVFTHAFSNSPLCSPTRASILTGQTPARHGIVNPNIDTTAVRLHASSRASAPSNQISTSPLTATRLNTALPTLAKVLKAQNYRTAHFGKWHLGASPYSALEHGFDIDIPHFSGSGPYGGYLAPWSFAPSLKPDTEQEHIDMRLAKEAKKWILDNHKNGPFFVNFWPFSVHAPFNAKPALVSHFVNKRTPFNSQRSATYAAMVKHFDDAIAILYSALVDAGIEEDTIIVFTSDNGGNMYDVLGEIHPTSNFPLRGGKATQYDGGSRVPTFIIWPGVTQANTSSDIPIQTADFYPTLLSGLGVDVPANHIVDGIDIRPLFGGRPINSRPIITYYPTMPRVPDWLPPSATVLYDGWKLIKTFYYGEDEAHRYALYHVAQDIAETTNLAGIATDKQNALDAMLTEYLALSNAALPLQNPDYRHGAFNFSSIGTPSSQYVLPEESVASSLVFNVSGSQRIAHAGDTVTLSWELVNTTGASNVSYQQFMGPSVSVSASPGAFSFIVPEVHTSQFVSFAFIAKDNSKTVRKQVGVQIVPVNSAPRVTIANEALSAKAGQTVVVEYELNDANKDNLILRAQSTGLAIDENLDVTKHRYEVTIPASFAQQQASITFSVSDKDATHSKTVNISVLSASNGISTGDKGTTSSGSAGGGSIFTLLGLLIVAIATRYNKHIVRRKYLAGKT
jgi:arylsulfatase A-like enzyme